MNLFIICELCISVGGTISVTISEHACETCLSHDDNNGMDADAGVLTRRMAT